MARDETERDPAAGGRWVRPGPATRRAARNAVAVATAEMASKVATLAYTIAAARTLGQAEFGIFGYALSFSLLVATLPAWGFDNLLIQRASRDRGRLTTLLSETLVWRTALAVPVFLAAGIGAFALRPDARSATALLIVLAATAVDVYAEAGRAAAAALEDQVGTSKALIVQRFVTAGLAIGALVAGLGLIGLTLAYLAGTLVGAAGVVVSVRRLGVRVDFRSVHWPGLRTMGRLSIAVGIDAVASLALFRIDQVMLEAIKGDAAVGVYVAAYRLAETVLFLSWAVSKAVFPVMSGATESWQVRRGVEQSLAAVALVYLPFGVGLWIEAEPVLRLLFGEAYVAQGVPVAHWLAGAPMTFALGYLGSYALFAQDRRWAIVGSTLTSLAANVALNLVLIPRFSSAGAAAATTMSYALEGILVLALLIPRIGMVHLHRVLAPALLASALMGGLLLAVPAGLAVEVPLAVAIYGVGWFLLARWLAPEQLGLLRSLIPGRGRTPEASS